MSAGRANAALLYSDQKGVSFFLYVVADFSFSALQMSHSKNIPPALAHFNKRLASRPAVLELRESHLSRCPT